MDTLFLDKDGRWFHQGVEVTHERTCQLFCRHLTRGTDGTYWVKIGEEQIRLIVEDVPYVVRSVRAVEDENGVIQDYHLLLSDGSVEPLDPQTLRVGHAHVLYCDVKSGMHVARFSRQAYQLICAHLCYDEGCDRYWIPWRGLRCSIDPQERPHHSQN